MSWGSLEWPPANRPPFPGSSPQVSSVSPWVHDTISRLRLQPKESPRMRGRAGRNTARKDDRRMAHLGQLRNALSKTLYQPALKSFFRRENYAFKLAPSATRFTFIRYLFGLWPGKQWGWHTGTPKPGDNVPHQMQSFPKVLTPSALHLRNECYFKRSDLPIVCDLRSLLQVHHGETLHDIKIS